MSEEMQNVARDVQHWKLAPSYVIIDEGRSPQFGSSAGIFGLGVVLLGWFGVTVRNQTTVTTNVD
jgi:hypothetical protein